MSQLYDINVKNAKMEDVSLKSYQGKAMLIVNTASKCGFTPQYEELQKLYDLYNEEGLEILAFPCDQFNNQEPGDNDEIQSFCQLNFGLTFPVFSKIDVNGNNAHPLYQYLRSEKRGVFGNNIKWNFTKFLVDKEGNVIKRYAPTVKPMKIEKDIKKVM
jgi:glutathione peroxidase